MAISITEAELLEALAHSQKPGEDGARTVSEMAMDTGLVEPRIRKALKVFQAQGRLTVYHVPRPSIDGTMRRQPAYVISKKKK